jgi:hypothetical protein
MGFFEDHIIPPIFSMWFFVEFDIVTYSSNVQGGVLWNICVSI